MTVENDKQNVYNKVNKQRIGKSLNLKEGITIFYPKDYSKLNIEIFISFTIPTVLILFLITSLTMIVVINKEKNSFSTEEKLLRMINEDK